MPRPTTALGKAQTRVPKKYGTRYPWDKWFRKGTFTLTKGKEFKITLAGMAKMVRNRASERRVSLRVVADEEKMTLKVTVVGGLS